MITLTLKEFKRQFENFKAQVNDGTMSQSNAEKLIDGFYIPQLDKINFINQKQAFGVRDMAMLVALQRDVANFRKEIFATVNTTALNA
ncbi:MAG: hypothetical protein IJW36_02595 [Clostridia bacterium]|nr:hypothetical protein [Clostridia bacterium]